LRVESQRGTAEHLPATGKILASNLTILWESLVKAVNTLVPVTAALILAVTAPPAAAQQLLPVVSGLSQPVFVGHAGDGSNRLFVVERAGVIKVLQPGASTPTVFLDIHTRVLSNGSEQGLLGLAFHPSYESNGRFFVFYTRTAGEIVIAEYHIGPNPNVADLAETILLTIPHPGFSNHNGGMLAVDHENYLRAGVGDGGNGNDPPNNAQNLGTLLGKILRIDIDPAPGTGPYAIPANNPFVGTPGARPEIFAYGMRNPWRFSFDRVTHDQWVADVGQGAREEVDTPIVSGGNYGWRVFEGFSCTGIDLALCGGSGYIAPLFEYTHSGGRCSITGGYVYRGSQHAVAGGTYIYGDYCTGEIFGWDGASQRLLIDTASNISSFGEDESGELYVVGLGGTVHKIVSSPPVTGTELLSNGDFSNGAANWLLFATPDLGHIVWNVTSGIFNFYRVAPAGGEPNQAVVFQHTSWPLLRGSPIVASFDIGNTSSVRKRLSVLIVDSDFSDLSVCTFWLAPNAPMRTYGMRTHTTEAWTNAAIYFYAATTGSDGGGYAIDNVTMRYQDDGSDSRTDCLDPTAPAAQAGTGSNLVANGSFDAGLAGWSVFGELEHQLAGGVLEFYRPSGEAIGAGVLQQTGTAVQSAQILTAHFDLGNSSQVRKRVTVLLHDLDFSDLSACTLWLEPGQPLSTYEMRTFATEAWSNTTISVYAATVGQAPWIRLDNVSLQQTPGAVTVGTECIEPGDAGGSNMQAFVGGQQPPLQRSRVASRLEPRTDVPSVVTSRQSPWALETLLTLEGGTEASIEIALAPDPCRSTVTLEVSADQDGWQAFESLNPADAIAFRFTWRALRPALVQLRIVTKRRVSC
jgi:Glucose / Sorbosone dehydrogenase